MGDDMFNSEPEKVVFGFCISDYSDTNSNANAEEAAQVMRDLRNYYACNGGAFFWFATHDDTSSWSGTLSQEVLPYKGCSDGITPPIAVPTAPETPTTPQPTPAPFNLVTPTLAPVNLGVPTPSVDMTCPAGYTGLRAWLQCTHYYHCVNGEVTGDRLKCPEGTLFNEKIQNFEWDYNFECPSDTVPTPVSEPTPAPETPTIPQPTQGTEPTNNAYITWHNYYDGQSFTEVSCPDGENGLITKYGYSTLDPLIPYVSATSNVMWNSPNCGNCYAVSANGKIVHVTAIDQCGAGPSGEMHFDMHPDAFTELFGSTDVGIGYASFNEVSASNCEGTPDFEPVPVPQTPTIPQPTQGTEPTNDANCSEEKSTQFFIKFKNDNEETKTCEWLQGDLPRKEIDCARRIILPLKIMDMLV